MGWRLFHDREMTALRQRSSDLARYQARARNSVHALRLDTALMVKLQIMLDCDRLDGIAALRRQPNPAAGPLGLFARRGLLDQIPPSALAPRIELRLPQSHAIGTARHRAGRVNRPGIEIYRMVN